MRTQILYSEEQGSIPCMSIYSLQLGVRTIGCFEYGVCIEQTIAYYPRNGCSGAGSLQDSINKEQAGSHAQNEIPLLTLQA